MYRTILWSTVMCLFFAVPSFSKYIPAPISIYFYWNYDLEMPASTTPEFVKEHPVIKLTVYDKGSQDYLISGLSKDTEFAKSENVVEDTRIVISDSDDRNLYLINAFDIYTGDRSLYKKSNRAFLDRLYKWKSYTVKCDKEPKKIKMMRLYFPNTVYRFPLVVPVDSLRDETKLIVDVTVDYTADCLFSRMKKGKSSHPKAMPSGIDTVLELKLSNKTSFYYIFGNQIYDPITDIYYEIDDGLLESLSFRK